MERDIDSQARLARLIGAELQALPPCRAPAGLQARVLAELARRAALPWWRRSVSHWPMPAQALFAVLALAVTHVLFWGLAGADVSGVLHALRSVGTQLLQAAQAVGTGFGVLRWLARDLLAALPDRWQTAALLALASSLALLLGSGTFVYRSLQPRS